MKLKATFFAISLLIYSWVCAQNQPSKSIAEQISSGSSLEFIPNKGQFADKNGQVQKDILYLSHSSNVDIFLRAQGLSYLISNVPQPGPDKDDDDTPGKKVKESPRQKREKELKLRNTLFKACRVDMDFVGASVPVTENIAPTKGELNYYYPQCPTGITKVKAYQNILYKGIYPGINVSYKGELGKGLKYDIIVAPGGDPSQIKMKYSGTEKAEIADGKLLLTAFTGKMEERIPKIYQEINGQEINIEGNYVLEHQGKDTSGGTIVGIKINHYNKAYPLIIDPWWVTYCGASTGFTSSYSCAIDNAGNTLVTGQTAATNFPVSAGAFQTTLAAGALQNIFVIKFDPNGNRLWATYYGGSGADGAWGITIDINNNVVVTGATNSTNFPVTAGAFQPIYGGGTDNAFVVKFDDNGNRLWGTYCGGLGDDVAYAITTDYAGNVAIAGTTTSPNFPVSAGAFQTILGGVLGNAFVVKFDPNGSQLWGTFFGGSGGGFLGDIAYGLSADATGNFAFAGTTGSLNLPISLGCFQVTPGPSFVAELDPNGNRLWATYFGGRITGCAVDRSNNVVIGGEDFNGLDISATAGAYETVYTTGRGFGAKFNSGGNRIWATWLNIGHDECGVMCMAVDEGNNAYFVQEPDPGNAFDSPSCAYQNTPPPTEELYVTKLDSTAHYSCSTYIGGNHYDSRTDQPGTCLAVRNGRMACVTMTGGGIPVTPGAFQPISPGGTVPGVFNLCSFGCGDTIAPALSLSNAIIKTDTCLGYVSFTAHASAFCDTAGAIFLWSFPGGSPSSAIGPNISHVLFNTPGTYTLKLKYIACSIDSLIQSFTVKSGFHDSLTAISPTSCHQTGKAIANPGNGVAPYTYWWSNGGTAQSDTGLTAGTYTSVITANNGCADTLIFLIKPNLSNPPLIPKPKDTGYCVGGSIPLSVSKGSNYSWLPVAGLSCTNCANPTATPSVTTTYTITGIDSVGCPDSAKIIVLVDSLPDFKMKSIINYCTGNTLLYATSSGDYIWTWAWSPGAELSDSIQCRTIASPTATTTYTLTAHNQYCFNSNTITVSPVAIGLKPIIKAVPDTVCQGATISLSATPYSLAHWTWSPATGLSCTNCANPTLNTALLTLSSSTYTVALKTRDSVGSCHGYDTIKLTIISPHINQQGSKVCKGYPDTLYAHSSSGYVWSTGATSSSIVVSPFATTTYYVLVDSLGCHDSLFHKVIIDTVAHTNFSLVPDSICVGSSAAITATNADVKTWGWVPPATLSCSNCPNPTATPTITTTYTVSGADSLGCTTIDNVTLNVIALPAPVISGKMTFCKGKNDTLYASGGTSYVWGSGLTGTSITLKLTKDSSVTLQAFNGKCTKDTTIQLTISPSPTVTITPPVKICAGDTVTLQAGGGGSYLWNTGSADSIIKVTPTVTSTYSVTVTNAKGCTIASSTKVTIDVPALFACCDATILAGTSVALNADSSLRYKWYPSTGLSCDTCAQITVSPTVTTTYTVIGTDQTGCQIARIITIMVDEPCADFIVPNVFTPNGDGVNDFFVIKTEDLTAYSIIIYDRWGKEMYKSTDPTQYWDGNTEAGAKASDGVYYYIINSTCQGKTYDKHGYVQVIR